MPLPSLEGDFSQTAKSRKPKVIGKSAKTENGDWRIASGEWLNSSLSGRQCFCTTENLGT
jgi:hypothetical protein